MTSDRDLIFNCAFLPAVSKSTEHPNLLKCQKQPCCINIIICITCTPIGITCTPMGIISTPNGYHMYTSWVQHAHIHVDPPGPLYSNH